MATIDYISDWQKKLRKRLYQQFRTKVTWQALADMLAAQFQDLEDAAQSVLSIVSIDDSEGVQLDQIGALIGQPRLGVNDSTYRGFLRARIIANRAAGRIEEIYRVLNASVGEVGYKILLSGAKAIDVIVVSAIDAFDSYIAQLFVRDCKDAGVHAIVEWRTSESNTFCFLGGVGGGFDVGLMADAREV